MRRQDGKPGGWIREVLLDLYGVLVARDLSLAARHVMDAVNALERATERQIRSRIHAQEMHLCWALHVIAEQARELGWEDVAEHLDQAASAAEAHLTASEQSNVVSFPPKKS